MDLTIRYIRCGSTIFRDRGFRTRYLSDFHTFHLHHYHGQYRLGEVTHRLSPGVVTLSPAGIPSYYDVHQAGKHAYLHFRMEDDITLAGGPVSDPDGFYSRQLNRIVAYSRSPSSCEWVAGAMRAAIEELVWRYLADTDGEGMTGAVDAVDQAYALLEERYDEPVYVPALATSVGLSSNYLAKLFRERYGKTIKRRLLEIRLDRAKYLLLNTDLPISQVGERSGVPDPQYFNKVFRREIGRSPSSFRRDCG